MNPETPIVKVKHGRVVQTQPQVLVWRKKMSRFRALKAELVTLFANKGWDNSQIQAWLNTPSPALRQGNLQRNPSRTPKQLLNPESIGLLITWARKVL